jgi:HEAT repeat protein
MFKNIIFQRYISATLGIIYTAYSVVALSTLLFSFRADAQSPIDSEACSETAIANHIQRFSSSGSDGFDALIACGENSVAPLIQVLNNTSADPLLRRLTARALGQIGTKRAISALLEVSSNSFLSDSVRRAIADINPAAREAVPVLLTALANPSTLNDAILVALERIDPSAQAALPALVEALNTKDHPIRNQSIDLLKRLGEGSSLLVPELISTLGNPDERLRAFAAYGLAQQGKTAQSATPQLIAALGDQSDRVRTMALTALGRIGSAESIAAVVKVLKNRDSPLRDTAAIVISHLEPNATAAVPVLTGALGYGGDEVVRSIAAYGLGQIGTEARSAIPKLIHILWDSKAVVRGAAVDALSKIELNNEAVVRSLLLRLHWEQDAEVRDVVFLHLALLPSEEVPLIIKVIQETRTYQIWQTLTDIDGEDPQFQAIKTDRVFYYGIALLWELRDQGSTQAKEFLDQLYQSNESLWDAVFSIIVAAADEIAVTVRRYVSATSPVICRIGVMRRFLWRCR